MGGSCRTGEGGGRRAGGTIPNAAVSKTVTAGMIAFRWAAVSAILAFHFLWMGANYNHKSVQKQYLKEKVCQVELLLFYLPICI